MDVAKFYEAAKRTNFDVKKAAEVIGKCEVTTLRKIVDGGFKQSEIAMLKEAMHLTDKETAEIFFSADGFQTETKG